MTARAHTAATDRACARALDAIGLPRARWILLAAVHEAAHVVVADTVDMTTIRVRITPPTDVLGRGEARLLSRARIRSTLPQMLPVFAAGFEGTRLWMRARGFLAADTRRALALSATGDALDIVDACRAAGRDDLLPPEDDDPDPARVLEVGALPAGHILTRRWSTVMRLAYRLARVHHLEHRAVEAHLSAPHQAFDAAAARTWWRQWAQHTHPLPTPRNTEAGPPGKRLVAAGSNTADAQPPVPPPPQRGTPAPDRT